MVIDMAFLEGSLAICAKSIFLKSMFFEPVIWLLDISMEEIDACREVNI